ncbi:MAG: N-acyl homoserine lactonase family protein [Winogradskyella sp.]|uniref:N-acyl homoserine lactonase family protein n=1 Tax=Winogradskyella sp. TaxID=1883156 RepID=UPI00183E3CB4|nr:N-acyl homoserine lactonase family protein [Winogradskyella sp.]MBT8244330.1 N-acyl homoserine lactonase family protein [Winogradskyella sp.]NNK22725.1 N-acyl homoserine lactonase family protein [Winogradskyella sp.]
MKKLLLLLVIVLGFSSCKDFKEGLKDGYNAAKKEAEATKKQGIKLYTLDGGTVQANKLELFSQDTTYTGQSKTFADAFYVIVHPKGTLMWDTGLPESLVGLPEPFTDPSGAFTVSRNDSVVSQLSKIDMTPADIDFLALSHTHFDHSGHAEKIKNAKWLVQETEYNFITSEEVQKNNADIYNAVNDLQNVQKLNGDYDVFEDGTVIIKSMPGHTPGHQVLFLKLENAGNVLLTGDLYHFQENRDSKGVPSFNYDADMTLKSMDEFEAFAKQNNADVYIQHSKDDFYRLPKYPKYLD